MIQSNIGLLPSRLTHLEWSDGLSSIYNIDFDIRARFSGLRPHRPPRICSGVFLQPSLVAHPKPLLVRGVPITRRSSQMARHHRRYTCAREKRMSGKPIRARRQVLMVCCPLSLGRSEIRPRVPRDWGSQSYLQSPPPSFFKLASGGFSHHAIWHDPPSRTAIPIDFSVTPIQRMAWYLIKYKV